MPTIYERLHQIRAYALTAKTAIYNEDAMTAIELAGVTACKVNECVNAINELVALVEQITMESTGIRYDASEEAAVI